MGYYKKLVTDKVSDSTRRKNLKRKPTKPFPYEVVRLSLDEVPLEQARREYEEYLQGSRKYPTYRLHREVNDGWLLSLIDLEPPEPTVEWVWTLRRPIRKPPKPKPIKHDTNIDVPLELANLKDELWRKARVKNRSELIQGELVQEAMLAIWKSAPKFKGKSNFAVWANVVAESSMNKWFRARAAQWKREEPNGLDNQSGATSEEDRGEEWDAKVRCLYAALAIVPESELVVQRYAEDIPYSVMAKELGTSEPALRKQVQRVKASLRKVMEAMAG